MKLFIKLLLIASLGVASLAASNTYMTAVERLQVGHVLAEDITLGELVVQGDALHVRTTTLAAGTPLGPTQIALLRSEHLVDPALDPATLQDSEVEHIRIEDVTCYAEPGAESGDTISVPVAELVPGQVLGMDAEVLWISKDESGDVYRRTRVIVPEGAVVSDRVIGRLLTGLSEELAASLTEAGVQDVLVDEILAAGLTETHRQQLNEAGVDAPTLAILDMGGVEHVRVTDFRFSQWEWKWWFAIGCAGMLVAALLARKTAPRGGASEEAGYTYESTSQHLREMLEMLKVAWADAQQASTAEGRCRTIVHHLDQVKAGPQFEVNEGLGAFKTRGGYAHYARIVDAFAFGERQVHRAWSAAVDEVEEEAMLSLSRAIAILSDAVAQL